MKKIFLLSCVAFLAACAGQPTKDLVYRSRLPTQAIPLVQKVSDRGAWGMNVNLESQRYTTQPTNNLVENYRVDYDSTRFSSTQPTLAGIDLSGSYLREIWGLGTKWSASFDFVELELNPSELLHLPADWYVGLNVGGYMTATFQETSSCGFICFDAKGSQANQAKENSISASQGGWEQKAGLSIGKIWNGKEMVVLSYSKMNYDFSASVSEAGHSNLDFHRTFSGVGEGVGFYEIGIPNLIYGVTFDNVHIHLPTRTDDSPVIGIRTAVIF